MPSSALHSKNTSYHVLRVAMAITFLWIGLLIFREPIFWSGFVPVYIHDMFTDITPFMLAVGAFDVIVGLFLLLDWFTFWIALFATFHLFGILLLTGVDETTVRDIGLVGGSLALAMTAAPEKWKKRFAHKEG